MQAIQNQLQETLQTLYRKAIDADNALNQLQREQKGKFQTIFNDDQGFSTQAKRFSPYVEEIASDWQAWQKMNEEEARAALPPMVKKIELLFSTINQFQTSLTKN